jgi:hypothetical protein
MFARNDQHGEACHRGQVVPEDDEDMTLLMNATDKGVVAVLFFSDDLNRSAGICYLCGPAQYIHIYGSMWSCTTYVPNKKYCLIINHKLASCLGGFKAHVII